MSDKSKQEIFLESPEVRESYMERIEILNKVKHIVVLENTEIATLKMVAEYYQVTNKAIESLVMRHTEELTQNGMTLLRGEELKDFKKSVNYKSNAASITFFTRRTMLNIAMLLRDSEVAKEIRLHLLNLSESEEAIETISKTIDEEKLLAMNVVFAETEEARLIALGNYREYKNKVLRDLESRVEVAESKVEDLLKTDSTISFREAKNILGVKERVFIAWLIHKDYLYRNTSDKLLPHHDYVNGNKPYFRVIFVTNKFKSKSYSQTVMTLEGVAHFRQFKDEINSFKK